MDDSVFSFSPSSFVFGSVRESGTQINSGSLFTCSGNNSSGSEANSRQRRRFTKARKIAKSASSTIPMTNSVDPLSSKSATTQNCFTFGQVTSFSSTINDSAKSGLDVEKTVEAASEPQQENIKPGVTKIETNPACEDAKKTADAASEPQLENIKPIVTKTETNCAREMDVLPPTDSKQNTVAKEANQEPVAATSLIKISRILKETVEQIHYLRVDDFWVRGRELWKTMGELQNMGYHVIPLRKRLLELSDAMMELELTKLGIKNLMIKAENHRIEKCRLEFMILNLQERIRKEHHGMVGALSQMAEMEEEVPKFDDVFAKLAKEPL